MELWMVIVIGASVVAAVVAITTPMVRPMQRRRSATLTAHLRQHFGPDYANAAGEQGRSDAEAGLLEHDQAAGLLPVSAPSANEVLRYSGSWTATQRRFVDDPDADPYLLRRGLGPRPR